MLAAVQDAVAMGRGAKHLGEFVRRTREARGMTQSELAQRSGIGQGQISQMEAGRSHVFRPSIGAVSALAMALGQDAAERGRLLRTMLLTSGMDPEALDVVLTFDLAMNRVMEDATAVEPALAGACW